MHIRCRKTHKCSLVTAASTENIILLWTEKDVVEMETERGNESRRRHAE